MSQKATSVASLVAGLAVMTFSGYALGETPIGWATMFAGIGVYFYGWRGVCPACRAGACKVEPAKDAASSQG